MTTENIRENLTNLQKHLQIGDTITAVLFDISASFLGALRRGDIAFDTPNGTKHLTNIANRLGIPVQALEKAPDKFNALYQYEISSRFKKRINIIQRVSAGEYDNDEKVIHTATQQEHLITQAPIPAEQYTNYELEFIFNSYHRSAELLKNGQQLCLDESDIPSLRLIVDCFGRCEV